MSFNSSAATAGPTGCLSNVPAVGYTRGNALSGTLAGAGGIGGLLARYRHSTSSPYAINGSSFYHADGNGKIPYLANSAGGTDAAYRYDPFGRWQAHTGSYAAANVMQFSSKPWLAHHGSATDGLYYYGYRFYDPNLQRWPNRDPLGEPGFELLRRGRPGNRRSEPNLCLFVRNSPLNKIDALGLERMLPPGWHGPGQPYDPSSNPFACHDSPCTKAIKGAGSMLGNVSNDARAHCIASCQIAKACGQRIASALGTLKDARDLTAGGIEWAVSWVIPRSWEEWLHDQLQGGNTDDSADDFYANGYGLDLAKGGKDCVSECEKKFGPGP